MIDKQKIKNSVILYIEDDAITRKGLSQYLRLQCKELYVAKDGEEGLALYKNYEPDIVITEPDIVITDIEMPKLDGLAMAQKIRKISQSTQIIIVTAYTNHQYFWIEKRLKLKNILAIKFIMIPIQKSWLEMIKSLIYQNMRGL